MEALARRQSSREFARDALPMRVLSDLLWAAYGVNRGGGGRTAPSALNCQEVDVFVALPGGAYRYDATAHALQLVAASDLRRVTGYQDFVDEAPLVSRGTQFSPDAGIEIFPPGSRFGLFRADETGLQRLFEPIRIAADVQGHRVMQ